MFSTSVSDVINNWTTEYYLNILMAQCEKTRTIVERLDKLNEKNKYICQSFVIGLLKDLNNELLDKYSKEEYLEGINTLCQFYYKYRETEKECFVIKKGWMNEKHRSKFFN